MNLKKRIYQIFLLILYLGMIFFYVFESLKNQVSSQESSSLVSSMFSDIIGFFTGKEFVISKEFDFFIRKLIGHFLYFVCLGIISILLYFSFADNMKKIVILGVIHFFSGFIFSFITEFVLQLFAEGRYPSFNDVILDFVGFVFVSGIIFNYVYFSTLKKNLNLFV